MSDFMDKQKDEFDNFVDKWEKAQQAGIFKDADMPAVNPQTSTGSFFGFTQANPTDSANQTDTQYWNAINIAADDHDPSVLNEEAVGTGNDEAYLRKVFSPEEIAEMHPDAKKDAARAIAMADNEDRLHFQGHIPWHYKQRIAQYMHRMNNEATEHKPFFSNPVAADTVGNDQDPTPQSLGMTYSEEDLNKLEELKKELFGLENKLMTSLGFGDDKNQKKLQGQIESVKKEIQKISDDMGRAYKNPDQPKHLENL